MISFNPYFRVSVDEALQHPFFAGVRNPALEASSRAPAAIEMPFEDFLRGDNLTRENIRKMFLQEIKVYSAKDGPKKPAAATQKHK